MIWPEVEIHHHVGKARHLFFARAKYGRCVLLPCRHKSADAACKAGWDAAEKLGWCKRKVTP
jgi:hypothetical protein